MTMQLGVVTGVNIDHSQPRITLDVTITPAEEPTVRYIPPASNIWFVPSVQDVVQVAELTDGNKVAFGTYTGSSLAMPSDIGEGDLAVKLNSGSKITATEASDGTYDVNIEVDGDAKVDAQNIYLGSDGSRKALATEDHTHGGAVSKPSSSGLTSKTDAE